MHQKVLACHGRNPRLLGVDASDRNRRKFTTDVNDVPLLSYVHKQLGSLAQLCGKPTLAVEAEALSALQ